MDENEFSSPCSLVQVGHMPLEHVIGAEMIWDIISGRCQIVLERSSNKYRQPERNL